MCAATAKCAVVGRTPYVDVPVTRPVIRIGMPSQIPARLISGQWVAYCGGSLPLVLLLAACGGGGGGGGGADPSVSAALPPAPQPPAPQSPSAPVQRTSSVNGSLYDGPIESAAVYVDVNGNRRVDDEDHLIDEATDSEGNFEGEIPERYQNLPLIADNRGAIHRDSHVELPPFFVASARSGVISPITHIVELKIASKQVIRGHVLFGRQLRSEDNELSRPFSPFEDNPYDGGAYVFGRHIRSFLEALTKAIRGAGDDHVALRQEVHDLLERYQQMLSDAANQSLGDGNDKQEITSLERVEPKPHLSSEVEVSVPTPGLSQVKLDPLTISTRSRGSNEEKGQERDGFWNVYSRNIGGQIILKVRVGEGDEQVVGRLVWDESLSGFRLDTSGQFSASFTKIAGVFGYLQITDVTNLPNSEEGYIHTQVSWKYTVFFKKGSGAPINRLQLNDKADEQLHFITESGEDLRDSGDVTFTARGTADMPLMLLAERSATGDLSDEFPFAIREADDVRHWRWWPMTNIVGEGDLRTIDVNPDDRMVLRFVPIDVEGDYFKTPDTDAAPRTYGDIATFIREHVQVRLYKSESPSDASAYFEVVQATDREGSPGFIEMPDGSGLLPVLELRLKDHAPSFPIHAVITLLGGGPNVPGNLITLRLALEYVDLNDLPPDFTSGTEVDPVAEDVATGTNAQTRGDGKVIYTARATPDVRGDSVTYSLKQNAGDDSAMFGIDAGTGAVWFVTAPDRETKSSYSFTVIAHVGEQMAEQTVTVTVTDVNDVPTIISGGAIQRLLVAENTGGKVYRPDLVMDDAVTSTDWSLSGRDAHLFTIDQRTGAIRFREAPDFEAPRDAGKDNSYQVTLTVTTADDAGRKQSATQQLEINVTDVSVVISLTDQTREVREDYAGPVVTVHHLVDEDDFGSVTYSLSGLYSHLYKIAPSAGHGKRGRAELSLIRPLYLDEETVNFGDGSLHPVTGVVYMTDVVVTATWEDGRTKSSIQPVWVMVHNNPDAPGIKVTPAPGFYILTTDRSALRDTGYRAVARDKDGNLVKLTMRDNKRFKIDEDNRIWIKKKKVFGSDDTDGVVLFLKATDTSPDRNVAVLKFKIPVRQRLDNIDDMFSIVGDAQSDVDENLPVDTGAYTPAVDWGEGYESSMPVIWSLHGADRGLLRIDPTTGIVRFVNSPDFESGRKVYEFTVEAAAVGGQIVNRKEVTIHIRDVDDNDPSEMLVVDVHEDRIVTPEELQDKAARKLAKIRFKDVDSQAGNRVEIDSDSMAFFEIRLAQKDQAIGVYRLWVKDGVQLAEGDYSIIITPVINGVRREDMKKTFSITVERSNALPDNPPPPDGPPTNETVSDEARVSPQDNNQQSTNVVDDTDPSWDPDPIAPATVDIL